MVNADEMNANARRVKIINVRNVIATENAENATDIRNAKNANKRNVNVIVMEVLNQVVARVRFVLSTRNKSLKPEYFLIVRYQTGSSHAEADAQSSARTRSSGMLISA